jgi:hypothetical protein
MSIVSGFVLSMEIPNMHRIWRLARGLSPVWFALVFAGCSTQHATYVPDGRRGFVITCGGVLSSWSSCLVKAGRACGNHGYETVRGDEEDRTILIACLAPGAERAPSTSSP